MAGGWTEMRCESPRISAAHSWLPLIPITFTARPPMGALFLGYPLVQGAPCVRSKRRPMNGGAVGRGEVLKARPT